MASVLSAAVFCLLVSSIVSKHPSTTVDVACGNPSNPKTPAIMTYKGNAVAVFGYGPSSVCKFQEDQQTGDFVLQISYNPNDTCSFRQGLQEHYHMKVESRMLHELFEGADDEKFLIECTFMVYKPNVSVSIDLKERYKPADYLFYPMGRVASSDFELYIKGLGGKKLTGTLLEGTVVTLHTLMTPNASESTYMPLECLIESQDGKVKVQILASGCGTGFPWKTSEGFTMNKTHGDSPEFKMFRISKKQGVVFKCSFVICKGACDGDTCKASNIGNIRKRRSIRGLKYNNMGLLSDKTRGIERAAFGVHLSNETRVFESKHIRILNEDIEDKISLTL